MDRWIAGVLGSWNILFLKLLHIALLFATHVKTKFGAKILTSSPT